MHGKGADQMEQWETIFNYIVIGWYCGYIYFIAYLHVHHSIPYRNEYNEEYCKSIPNRYAPGILSMLMYKKITPEVFTASIFSLIKRNVLGVVISDNKYILYLVNPEYKNLDLGSSQKYLLDFLVDIMGEENKISLDKLYNYCSGNTSSSSFLLNYQIWKQIILKESCKIKFFEDKVEYTKVHIYKRIGLVLVVLNFILQYHLFLGYFLLVPIYFLPLYFYKIFKRTVDANEEYYKWLAFKNYLANLSNFTYDKQEMDKYLIYATVLKVNNEFANQVPNVTSIDFVNKLNIAINRCVIKATLYGNRGIKKFGSKNK